MGTIADLKFDIESYPENSVEIEIYDVAIQNGSARLNIDEVGRFRVRVTNRGALIMRDVTVKIVGLNGVMVKPPGALAQYEQELVYELDGPVAAHGGSAISRGSALFFKAPSNPLLRSELFGVTINDWTADLDHILENHSQESADPRAVFEARVLAA